MSHTDERRILYVTQHFPPETSGNASRVYDMARNLVKAGAEVKVLCPHPTFPHGSWERTWRRKTERTEDGVRVINLGCWQPTAEEPGFLSRMAYYLTFPIHAALWALLHRKEYDVVVSSSPPLFTGIPGLMAKRLLKDKTLVTEIRDLWLDAAIDLGFVDEQSLSTRLGKWFENKLYESSDLLGVTTEEVARKVRAHHQLNGTAIELAPNGVDTDLFQPAETPEPAQRFVYAGNIGPAQDLETVIEAIGLVREDHPDAELVLVGDGETRPRLEQLTRELDLEDAVRFPGRVPREEIPALYQTATAGLAPLKASPALEYAIPTKAYECMACGVPFIGMGIGEIRSLAEESGGGVIAENDPGEVAAAMRELIETPKHRAGLGHDGRRYVEENVDRGAIASSFYEAIKGVTR